MSLTLDPALGREIARFGAGDLTKCMNCGNCTAVCPLSRDSTTFPRRTIRYLQLGAEERVLESLEPWLCYYCGECSDTCPREADPGETMMAARRWLTARYDVTGLSRRLYLSRAWEVLSVVVVGLAVLLAFALFHGPVVTERVELNTFAPVRVIEYGDWLMAAALGFFLLLNASRMHHFVMKGVRAPFSAYVAEFGQLLLHASTQKRWRECEDRRPRWWKHLLLVTGYVTMFLLVVVFLRWFQTDEVRPLLHPTRILGYLATAALLFVAGEAMWSRWKKRERMHRHSHLTDWMFLALLFLTALTGILVHAARLSGLPLTTYGLYALHLAIAVPMLIVEVPFGKWAHMLYRPLAVYLSKVRERAREHAEVGSPAATGV